jgi:hypothetical protein
VLSRGSHQWRDVGFVTVTKVQRYMPSWSEQEEISRQARELSGSVRPLLRAQDAALRTHRTPKIITR